MPTFRPEARGGLGPYVRCSIGLSLFNPVPHPVYTGWAGTHDDVPIIEWLTDLSTSQIHTPSCLSLVEMRSVRTSSLAYPRNPLFADSLTLDKHRFHRTGDCSRVALLEPLSPSHCRYSAPGPSASVDVYASNLTRLTFSHLHACPSEGACATLTCFGLAIRLMVDGHHP